MPELTTAVPFILNVDVEPEERDLERRAAQSIASFEWLGPLLATERHRLEDALQSPVRYLWHVRVDPQIAEAFGSNDWILRRYEREFSRFTNAGDQIGLHPHLFRWDNAQSGWFVDDGNQEWVDEVLGQAFDAYAQFFGRACEMLRMGDGFTNQATMRRAEALGAKYELTPEPETRPERMAFFPERHSGQFPDCRGIPVTPYRPSVDDWRVADPARAEGMIILPISTGCMPGEWFPEAVFGRIKEAIKRAAGLPIAENHLLHTANLSRPSQWNAYLIDDILANRPRPFVNLAVRTNSPTPERAANLEATFRFIEGHARRREFVFATPAQAWELLGTSECVPPGNDL